MADRYSFQSPFARDEGNAWFTLGNLAVTTTVAVTGLGVLGLFLVVVEGGYGPLSRALLLDTEAITGGQLWRLVTWPIPPSSTAFWALLGLIFFFMIGSQFERMIGRTAFVTLMAALVLIPGLLGALVAVLLDESVPSFGLSMAFLGIAAGFSAAIPQARSFFGIPFWVLVAFFFVVQFLDILTARSMSGLVILISTGIIGLVLTRSFGHADSIEWIPSVSLPAALTGSGTPRPPRRKRRQRNAAGLRSVPTTSASEAEIDALLDQVNEHGIDSLTRQQKATLERHAKEMRRKRDER